MTRWPTPALTVAQEEGIGATLYIILYYRQGGGLVNRNFWGASIENQSHLAARGRARFFN